MCQLKALAVTKELGITGFEATLRLCQVAAGKRVLTWLVAGEWRGMETANDAHTHAGFYLHETHYSYNVRADRRVSSRKFIFS